MTSCWMTHKAAEMMNEYSEFKPVDRSRAYTWHGNHSGIDDGCSTGSKFVMSVNVDSGHSSVGSSSKKPWSRRNAWGSMSYADLIGKAIESTVDKRMTLSQIYEWMIQNVPYFHDKGAGSSSTGWKNSIRHNLSLHRRFKRVPNEDSGKSSWWMLNDSPDQCPPTRKRTVSVGKFEQKDLSPDVAPPSAKLSHVAVEPPQTTSLIVGPSSASQPWLQSVQPLSTYGGGTIHVPESHLQWQQLSTETDPFFVADLDPSFASPSFTPTSCTPLAPISELLSPQQFPSYDLQTVEIPSLHSYVAIQTVSSEQSSFAGHSLTALSSVPMLDVAPQPSHEMYPERVTTPGKPPVMAESTLRSTEGLQTQGPQWTPGWSMLRQMLSQSHRENALMHGVVSDGRPNPTPSEAEYSHTAEDRPLQPPTTAALQFISPAITDVSYVTSPQQVPASDVLYVHVTADPDDISVIRQITATDDTEAGSQQQSVITGYSEVTTTGDISAPKMTDADNNNESVAEEKTV